MPRSPYCAALRVGMVSLVAGGFAVASTFTPADAVTTSAPVARHIYTDSLGGMTVANDGTLYVNDSSGNLVTWSRDSIGMPDVTKVVTGVDMEGFSSLRTGSGLAYVADGTASVVVMNPSQAAGPVVPVRTITGAATKLDAPTHVAWTPSGSLWVSDVNPDGQVELLRFAPGADGNAAPVQVLRGPRTGLFGGAFSGASAAPAIAGLPGNGVAAAPAGVDPVVSVFTGAQHGNTAPHRFLQVPTPTPHWLTTGIAADPQGRIYVGSGQIEGLQFGRLDVFGPTGSEPILTLAGAQQRFQIALAPTVAPNGTLALGEATLIPVSGFSSSGGGRVDVFKPLFAKPGKVRALKVTKTKKSRKVSWAAPSFRGNTAAPLSYRVVVKKGAKTKLSRTVKGTSLTIARKALPKHKSLKVTVSAVNVGGSGAGVTKKFKN